MASTPQYAATPRCAVAQATAANTARDGTGTIATLFTAGASGSRVDRVVIKSTGVTTAGALRFFIHDGSNARLLTEVPVVPVTPSSVVSSFEDEFAFDNGLILPTGYSLRVATEIAETFNVFALGGDF